MNRLKLFIIGLFFAVVMFTGCNKEKQEYEEVNLENEETCLECDEFYVECKDFFLYANVEDFYKTAPFINAYLEHLSKDSCSDEKKLQALTQWLNSIPCIISAKLEPHSRSIPLEVPRGTIAILLDENGTIRELFLDIGPAWPYESDLWVATGYHYEKPREIIVATLPLFPTDMVFDFINSFDFEVLRLGSIYYYSTTHSHDSLFSNLVGKPYIAGMGIAYGTPISISPTFYSMENKNYQADWLKFIDDSNLVETNHFNSSSGASITFSVPYGKEREWAAKFLADYEFINFTGVIYGYRSMTTQ